MRRACSAMAQQGLQPGHNFRLHKKIAERGVQLIGDQRCQNHFGIGGKLQCQWMVAVIGQPNTAQLHIIFWRDHDFGLYRHLRQALAKLSTRLRKYHPIFRFRQLRSSAKWLACHAIRTSAVYLAQITEQPIALGGGIGAPARQRQLMPTAVAGATLAEQHMITRVRQQLDLRLRQIGNAKLATHIPQSRALFPHRFKFLPLHVNANDFRHPLLQQQLGRFKQWLRTEALWHARPQ